MKTPTWFWVVGVIVLLWNLMGLMAFIAQMTMSEEAMSKFPAEQQELFKAIPIWVKGCFFVAVTFGVLGSVTLLMRKGISTPIFIISLIGVIGQYGHMFFMTKTIEVMGIEHVILPIFVVAISIGLIPYTMFCRTKGFIT